MSSTCPPATGLLLSAALLIAGCGGSGDGDPEAHTPARRAAPAVVVPEGSEVRALDFFSGDGLLFHHEVVEGEAHASGAFPLLAYRQFCDDVQLGDFGLDRPRIGADVRSPDGTTRRLLVGATTFTGGGVYVSEPESPCVFLLTAADVHRLAATAGEEAAAPFAPPPKPELAPEERAEDRRPDPWVEQAERHPAGADAGRGADGAGTGR